MYFNKYFKRIGVDHLYVCAISIGIQMLENTPRYFTLFTNEMFCLLNVRCDSDCSRLREQ